jgi:hypothetical protein
MRLTKAEVIDPYDLQMITFRRFRNATFIARLSKKSPSRFLEEMQKKMTSHNAPQSTISQL